MKEYSKLNAWKLGLAVSIITAICVALTTIAGIYDFFPEYTNFIFEWLEGIYGFLGYEVSWLGVLLGAVYSFINIFVFVCLSALVYNKLLR